MLRSVKDAHDAFSQPYRKSAIAELAFLVDHTMTNHRFIEQIKQLNESFITTPQRCTNTEIT